jgi:hypothetical protein
VFPDSGVQASVLFSHYEPVASWDVVDTHGEFHHHPIQGKEDVQHLVAVALASELVGQFAPLPLVMLDHSVHAAINLELTL